MTHRQLSLVAIPIYIFAAVSSDAIIRVIYSDLYRSSAIIFAIYMLTHIYQNSQPDMVFRSIERTSLLLKYQILYGITSLFLFTLMIYQFNIFWAMIAKSFTHFIFYYLKIIKIKRLLKVKFSDLFAIRELFLVTMLAICNASLAYSATYFIFSYDNQLIELVLRSLIFFPTQILLTVLMIFSYDEKNELIQFFLIMVEKIKSMRKKATLALSTKENSLER